MKKRIWNKVVSIFTAILLVVGLVPNTTITALAAAEGAPSSLNVGNYQITSGDTPTYLKTGSTDGSLIEGSDNDWTVKYDPSTVTLTLKNATIEGVYNNVNTSGAGIYAASSSGPVSLNIVLEEENKVSGMYGIDVSSSGGSASLNISGSGSLTVSGHSGNGIGIFMSSQNSANLTIEEASVTALGSQVGGSGVRLITSQTGSPSLTIEVKGGSLQASGEANGIHFLSNVNDATAVANLNVSGNAMVKASNIITTKDGTGSAPELKPEASGSDGTGGIIWDDKSGTVYGDVTLQEDITISEGESLTIEDGASLNTGNNKVIVNGGTLNGEDKITGTVKYTPSITTASLPEGKVNEEYATSLSANGSEPITWNVTDGNLPTGLNLSTNGKITGTPTAPGEYIFTVTASNDVGSVSKELTITVKDVDPIYSIQNSGDISFADAIEGYTPEVKTIMITNDGNQPITLDQPSSTSFDVGTLSKAKLNVGETAEFTVQPKNGLLAGSYEEDIVITGTNNGKSVSTKVNVKFNVKHNAIKVERKDPTCTEKGNIEYWYCEACRKYFQDEALTKELKQEETILPATGHNLTKVDEKKPTVDAAGNVEYWYCEVCNKYFSDEKAEHEITLEDTIIAKLPKFVSGANQEWTKGSKEGLTFKIDTDIKEFKKVLVDGKELKDTDYDIKSGSTILTLKPSFLDTLSAGKHKIRFEFNTGSVEAYFTVKDKENSSQTESANTGVQNKYGLWIVLLLVAAGGLAGFGILSKRRKNHK
ncbi:PKD domain-containing protein [Faecalitalea cylindroides]|uniref:PKD domain-containing protein n=1 Tax=Faecalitalea cylindroides TaxID=39483 RepID=UPI00232C930E|nr:hypothetical protein [Faecalitalea cylindroides]MDB7952628.1 hypothetical protein [Faecalitalea cylindroides]MDB7959284.1 hypothetical protein [Faecalitalea cylindroides]MDB7961353.1 hypothetical protein [Faecalitalea cylindroides]MDB7963386.1 hypothetical protein [Faecalitalea cylindroides]MDB7965001.1 hypothetical protein [Faecalitalea cylindroides]